MRPTGDARGNGAFATALLPKGAHVCDYEGERISRQEYARRYPDGVVGGWCCVEQEGGGQGALGGVGMEGKPLALSKDMSELSRLRRRRAHLKGSVMRALDL